jgi:hypothetical protein
MISAEDPLGRNLGFLDRSILLALIKYFVNDTAPHKLCGVQLAICAYYSCEIE